MRKVWLLAFSFLIFLLSFNISSAQEINPTLTPQGNYELPYPGLLPDSPIYFLRAIRDKTVSFLISDPKKKAEFNLLQADKRLNAGVYLVTKNKIPLALSTISKAQNYFEQAIQKIKEAKSQGMEATEIISRLINSSKKHQEVLKSLAEKFTQNSKASFELQLERASNFEKEVRELMPKR